jgi:DNA-binding transcriptional MerR regulator
MLTISEFARLGQVSPRMLRHYGETGLLEPAQIDARTGYRFYDVAQLARLRRLVALRELGFSLEQIRPILPRGGAVRRSSGACCGYRRRR